MNETLVISSLLQFYKNQGMDLHYVLDDPVFNSLPLQGKVNAIKAHAQEIVDGTSPGYSRLDKKNLLTRTLTRGAQGALSGAAAGAAVGAFAKGFKYAPIAIGAVTGLSAGLASAKIQQSQEASAKNAVLAQLARVAKDPTDVNAIGVLSTKGVHHLQSQAKDEAYQLLRERSQSILSEDRLAKRIQHHMDMSSGL